MSHRDSDSDLYGRNLFADSSNSLNHQATVESLQPETAGSITTLPNSKDAVQKLPRSIKAQLRGSLDDWAVLEKETAKHHRSGEGIQFFERDGQNFRKTNRPNSGNRDWYCLVTNGWLKRQQGQKKSGSSESSTIASQIDARTQHEPENEPLKPTIPAQEPVQTNHNLALSIVNPDGNPMPDACYSVLINGQTFKGKLNKEGHGTVEHLPPGEAEVTLQPKDDELPALRKQVKDALDGLVNEALERKIMLNDLLFEDGLFNGTLIIGVIWTKAVIDRGVDLTTSTIDAVKGTPDAIASAKETIFKAMQDGNKDGVRDGYAYLATAAAELKTDVERLAAVTEVLMDDAEFWSMISAFPLRYYDSMSAEDQAKLWGAACFDIATCFIAIAALAKAATAIKTLKTSAGIGALLAKSTHFAPLVNSIKRIAHIHELKRFPLVKKVKINKHQEKLSLKQANRTESLPDKPVVHETKPAKTDTNKSTECNGQTCQSGEPISMVTGEELFEVVDFTVPGPVPVTWKRTYRSTASGTRSDLGYGWSHPWAMSLEVDGDTVWLRTEEGMKVPFSLPEHGATHRHVSGSSLSRFNDDFTVNHNGQHCAFTQCPNSTNRYRLAQLSNDTQSAFWQLEYDDTDNPGRLVGAKNSWGSQLTFSWNDFGIRKIRVQQNDSENSTVLMQYRVNSQGDLIAAKRPSFPTEQYRYDHHLFKIRQTETGVQYHFKWDDITPNARCISQVSDDGHYNYQFDWDYQGEDRPTDARVDFWNKTTDSNGVAELFGYDANALLLCHVQGDGGVEYFYYDGLQQLTKHINTEGQVQHYQYDTQQRLVQSTNVIGQKTHIRYWGNTQLPERITSPQGQQLHFAYNEHHQLIRKTFADDKAEMYQYQQGKLHKKTDPLGNLHQYHWHPHWGTLLRYEQFTANQNDAEPAQTVDFTYDDQGRLVSQTDQLGNEQHFVYDDQGQLITRSNQHGQAEHFQYDAQGRAIAQTDTAGRTTQFHYGRYAQLEAKTLPSGDQIKFEYDQERNLIALTNPNGAVHRFEYDGCERIKKETTVDGRTTEYQYNSLGHLTGLTDGIIQARFQRDPLGKLLGEHYHNPNDPNADVSNSFNYDDFGQLIRASNGEAEVDFKYNELGQLIQESSTHTYKGAFGKLDAHRHESHFSYTELGQLNALHHKAFKPETPDMQYGFIHRDTYRMRRSSWHEQYDWHANGALAAIHVGNDHSIDTLLQQDVNERGQITERQQGHHTLSFGYDAEQRLKQVQRLNKQSRRGDAVVQERQYQYDAAGRIANITDAHNGTTAYYYNALDQLTELNELNGTSEANEKRAEHFDPAGNRLPENIDKLLDNRLPFWGDRHYEYDAWGNIATIKRGSNQALVQQLTYNAKHQLVGLTEHHHGKFKQRITFAYDALGRRIRKEVFTDETNANYTHAEHYVWRGQHQIQTRSFDKSKRCKHDQAVVYEPNSHAPLALIDSDLGLLDIDTDHLGTPKALYDRASGEELWRTDHDTYGALKNEHSNTQHPKTGKGFEVNIRFQGQYQDRETGLYYNFNRYYDPHAGRYINHDPIGLMGGLNQYQYCPNPVEWVDPLGLSCKEGNTNPKSADGVPLSSEKIKEIQEIPKGDRPEPADYLPKSYIEAHLQKFDAGASRFMTASNLNKYGPGQRDGTSFVMPKSEADTLMSQAKGDKLALADSLGLPRTMLDSNELVRVDFNSPRDLGLRMPSGNEAGANEYWIPGGKLPDGASEAIIDVGDIPDSRYTTKTIK